MGDLLAIGILENDLAARALFRTGFRQAQVGIAVRVGRLGLGDLGQGQGADQVLQHLGIHGIARGRIDIGPVAPLDGGFEIAVAHDHAGNVGRGLVKARQQPFTREGDDRRPPVQHQGGRGGQHRKGRRAK